MKKIKVEAELMKLQCLRLVQQEPVRRSEQRAVQTPVFSQQNEVSYCSGFLFESGVLILLFFLKNHTAMFEVYDMIYLLTAFVLTPGGSSTVHIYTQTVHRTIQ